MEDQTGVSLSFQPIRCHLLQGKGPFTPVRIGHSECIASKSFSKRYSFVLSVKQTLNKRFSIAPIAIHTDTLFSIAREILNWAELRERVTNGTHTVLIRLVYAMHSLGVRYAFALLRL